MIIFNTQYEVIAMFVIAFLFTLLTQSRQCKTYGELGLLHFEYQTKISEVIFVIVFVFCLFLTAINRPEEMADYKNYIQAFNEDDKERFEPSLFLVKQLSNALGAGYLGFFIIYALLSISIKTYCILKMSNYLWLSLLIWISTSFILMDLITIRASVASGLMLLAIKYRVDGKIQKCLITLILAFLFHYSAAILFVIIPWISTKKTHEFLYVIIVPICAILQVLGLTLSKFIPELNILAIQHLYDGYSDDSAANLFNLLTLGRCAVAIFLWLRIKTWINCNPYSLFCLKIYTIGCALFMLLGDLNRVAFRFAELLWCADIIAYPMLTYTVLKRNRFLPIAVCIILFFIAITKDSYWMPSNT